MSDLEQLKGGVGVEAGEEKMGDMEREGGEERERVDGDEGSQRERA